MTEFTDQMNRTIRLESAPRRIVSLVPSQTQLLYYLGLEHEVIGITKFCIHPNDWFRSKDRIGGTKSVDIEKVRLLEPDLIIGNKEENLKEDIECLEAIAPIWMSDIDSLESALEMIKQVGLIINKDTSDLRSEINDGFNQLKIQTQKYSQRSVLYFIWNEPKMIAGKNTFIDEMLMHCGLSNASNDDRYPEVDAKHNPAFIFLSSEPYPFKKEHVQNFQKCYPDAKVVLVDGEMFSWYGSKLKDAPNYFSNLLDSIS